MEICDGCAVPYATASSIAQTLVSEGLIARDPGKMAGIALPLSDQEQVTGAITPSYFASAMRMAEAVNRRLPDLRGLAELPVL
ncbi:hypothetical protein [Sphingobium sp.]|uniref:hypothetical protein n=1 Tax=Sphingobium sp. TaxID=1912891 RepID=UPI0035C7807D